MRIDVEGQMISLKGLSVTPTRILVLRNNEKGLRHAWEPKGGVR